MTDFYFKANCIFGAIMIFYFYQILFMDVYENIIYGNLKESISDDRDGNSTEWYYKLKMIL